LRPRSVYEIILECRRLQLVSLGDYSHPVQPRAETQMAASETAGSFHGWFLSRWDQRFESALLQR